MTAVLPERPTGADLIAAMRRAAIAEGVSIERFAAPLYATNTWSALRQLEGATNPKPLTIERVQALLDGRPVPSGNPSPFQGRSHDGRYSRQRVSAEATLRRDEIWRRRLLAEQAHAERLPGETLQHAIRRIEGGAG